MSELSFIHPIVGQPVTANSNHATLLFYNALIQKELHKLAYYVSEVDHMILLVLMQVPIWFHNLLVQVGKSFNFRPRTWVGPFDSHKTLTKKDKYRRRSYIHQAGTWQMEYVQDAYCQL
jgi:hypothetical protein